MKNAMDLLPPKDRMTLARWYDSESWRALRRLIDIERSELAKDHVNELDMMTIRHLSGQNTALKRLVGALTANYKEMDRQDKAKTKKKQKR